MSRMKRIFNKHWNCLPWIFVGVVNLWFGDISRWDYGLAWFALLIMIWRYMPTISFGELEGKK